MLKKIRYGSRDEWLAGRGTRIGGSDASAILGLNSWMTNVELWERKTGRRGDKDISNIANVKYGTDAEEYLRGLFALDYPEYEVLHDDDTLLINDKYPYAHASLDGELIHRDTGKRGILEIKTIEILRSMQKEKWNEQIPDNYYCQLLHYLMVTEYEFAILVAQLKYTYSDEMVKHTRHYHIERADVERDIQLLADAEKQFYRHIVNDTKPALILPTI